MPNPASTEASIAIAIDEENDDLMIACLVILVPAAAARALIRWFRPGRSRNTERKPSGISGNPLRGDGLIVDDNRLDRVRRDDGGWPSAPKTVDIGQTES